MANEVTSFEVQGNNYDLKPNMTFDNTPTIGSNNPVTSNGIALAVQGVALSDNISYGRTEGSSVGYCSIAYGTNNIASAKGSITFGEDNTNASEYSLICGYGNLNFGEGKNAIFGGSNSVYGTYNITSGTGNIIGLKIRGISDNYYPHSDDRENNVYIGYVNPESKKIYYDPQMTNEIEVTQPRHAHSHYFVDLSLPNNTRNPGDVYKYERMYNTYTLTKMASNAFIEFTNICNSIIYIYMGISYYSPGSDKNYSDEAMTTEINWNSTGAYALYLDMNSGEFLLRNGNGGDASSKNPPKWAKMKVYKGKAVGYRHSGGIGVSEYWGRRAYICKDQSSEKYLHVFTSSDYNPLTDITDRLYDGEVVYSIDSEEQNQYGYGRAYYYDFNIDHQFINVTQVTYTAYCLSIGHTNTVGGGSNSANSTMAIGNNNYCVGGGFASAMIGSNNSTKTNGSPFFVVGKNNSYNKYAANSYLSYALGDENTIEIDGDNCCAFGHQNKIYGLGCYFSFAYGYHNNIRFSDHTHIIGSNNKVDLCSYANIIGDDNEICIDRFLSVNGFNLPTLKETVEGYYKEDGSVYIPNMSGSTYPTNQLFLMRKKTPGDNVSLNDNGPWSQLRYSTNGTELTGPTNIQRAGMPVSVFGYRNKYYTNIRSNVPEAVSNFSNAYNYMVGAYNAFYASKTYGVGLIGYHLQYFGGEGNPQKIDGSIRLGAYNDDSNNNSYIGGNKAQLVVGIGTSDNNRKNGFVVMQSGSLLAPECADTIEEATSASAISYNPNKTIVTYGMLQDYAPRTPGAVGKPAQTIVTLTVNGWSSDEQTVSVSNMSTSCVVIAQPNANPYAYNYHEVYVKEQGTDQLTFKCSTTPQVDIQVKVVYWT
jgi:hypothetical protein